VSAEQTGTGQASSKTIARWSAYLEELHARIAHRFLRACLVRVRVKPIWRSLAYAEDLSDSSLRVGTLRKLRNLPLKNSPSSL
jgi:hypothetical protein